MYLTSKFVVVFISIILVLLIGFFFVGVSVMADDSVGGGVIIIICAIVFFLVVAYNYPAVALDGETLKKKTLFFTTENRKRDDVKAIVNRFTYFEILFDDDTVWPVYDVWYSGGFIKINMENRRNKLKQRISKE